MSSVTTTLRLVATHPFPTSSPPSVQKLRPSDFRRPGEVAHSRGRVLTSYRVGALPIIDHLLERMRRDEFLRAYLPRADRRCRIAPSIGITLLLKNLFLSREPLYGIGEWAARF